MDPVVYTLAPQREAEGWNPLRNETADDVVNGQE